MSQLSIVANGGVLIEGGVITYVGASDEAEKRIAGHKVVAAGHRVVTPGLVDAHTHPVFGSHRANEFEMRSHGRSYQEIAASGGGIQSSVRSTRAASEEQLVEEATKRLRWFLANGVTTIEAKSGYGLSLDDELKMLRVLRRLGDETALDVVPTFLGAHGVPPEMSKEAYIELLTEHMLPQARTLARYCDIFCEERYFTLDDARRILGRAKELGFKLRMHVDQLTNGGGAALAGELGAATADHLEQTELDGIAALRVHQVTPVLLPGSVYALGLSRYPRARGMIEAGLPVVLASDFNPGSSPVASMPFVMNLACTQMKMSPAEAMTASTINAALSLDLNDRGVLEVGKRADLVIWDCEDYREIPYWIGAPIASRVIIEGEEVS